MPAYSPTTLARLLELTRGTPVQATATKQLQRFKLADGVDDPALLEKLAATDPALLEFLGDRLATAVFNLP